MDDPPPFALWSMCHIHSSVRSLPSSILKFIIHTVLTKCLDFMYLNTCYIHRSGLVVARIHPDHVEARVNEANKRQATSRKPGSMALGLIRILGQVLDARTTYEGVADGLSATMPGIVWYINNAADIL